MAKRPAAPRAGGPAPAAAVAAAPPAFSSGARGPFDPRAILTSIGEVVYDWDLRSDEITWGLNALDVLGLPDLTSLASGGALALATEPDSGRTRHEAIHEAVAAGDRDEGSGVPFRTRYALRLAADRVVVVEDTGRWYADAAGRAVFAHGVMRIEPGCADDLLLGGGTGGGFGARGRSAFLGQVEADVVDAARVKRSLTLAVAAIEDLSGLNQDLGYEGADEVLTEVERRLLGVMRRRDRLVRYASNRFGVALRSCPADQAESAARRLALAVGTDPVETAGGPVAVRLRVGAAAAPDHAADAPGLLRRAEEALAGVRTGGFALYDPARTRSETRARRSRGAPENGIVAALNERRVVLARQPVVEAGSRALAFSEGLVRVRTSDGRFVAAADILPAVEAAGLVPLLDARVLELAADHLARHPDERLSINVSPLTLERDDWLGTLAGHLGARPGIAPRLIVEITETVAVRDPLATRSRLDAMKALGVGLAIDDFGAGHTSFKHLRSFPVDLLKIDGAFVQNLARSTDDRFFVRTLVDLAHHLDIATVAEWVEDEETARLLASWGVDYLQGDHCGVPVTEGGKARQRDIA